MMNGKRPYHPQNPIRLDELEQILTTLARKILEEAAAEASSRGRIYTAEEIARQTIDHVYTR